MSGDMNVTLCFLSLNEVLSILESGNCHVEFNVKFGQPRPSDLSLQTHPVSSLVYPDLS